MHRSVRVTVTLPIDVLEKLDQIAEKEGRSRSNALARLIDQPEPSTVTTTAPVKASGDSCPGGGFHERATAKSGSGIIGCKKCQMIKRADNTWVDRS